MLPASSFSTACTEEQAPSSTFPQLWTINTSMHRRLTTPVLNCLHAVACVSSSALRHPTSKRSELRATCHMCPSDTLPPHSDTYLEALLLMGAQLPQRQDRLHAVAPQPQPAREERQPRVRVRLHRPWFRTVGSAAAAAAVPCHTSLWAAFTTGSSAWHACGHHTAHRHEQQQRWRQGADTISRKCSPTCT